MKLDAERPKTRKINSLDGPVIEASVSHANRSEGRLRRSQGEAVVLSGDGDGPVMQRLHRMVGSPVAELQFICFQSRGQTQQLMSETNAQDRHAAERPLDLSDGLRHGARVAGSIGEKDSRRTVIQDVIRRRPCRPLPDCCAAKEQFPENVLFDAKIEERDPETASGPWNMPDRPADADPAGQIQPFHFRQRENPAKTAGAGNAVG